MWRQRNDVIPGIFINLWRANRSSATDTARLYYQSKLNFWWLVATDERWGGLAWTPVLTNGYWFAARNWNADIDQMSQSKRRTWPGNLSWEFTVRRVVSLSRFEYHVVLESWKSGMTPGKVKLLPIRVSCAQHKFLNSTHVRTVKLTIWHGTVKSRFNVFLSPFGAIDHYTSPRSLDFLPRSLPDGAIDRRWSVKY